MKAVTHGGTFHADEIIACIIAGLEPANIARRFATPEEISDPGVLIIDTGGSHDPSMANFDHHQDRNLPAASSLVWSALWQNHCDEETAEQFAADFLQPISDCDTGKAPVSGLYAIVKDCNNLTGGFEQAYQLCKIAFASALATAKKKLEGKHRFASLPTFGRVTVNEGAFIPDWQELAAATGIDFLVAPATQNAGCWSVTSRDSKLFTIEPAKNQIFRHPSGFTAVYSTQKEAIAAGQKAKSDADAADLAANDPDTAYNKDAAAYFANQR